MSGSLKTGLCISGFNGAVVSPKKRCSSGACFSVGSLSFKESKIREAPLLATGFQGKQVIVPERKHSVERRAIASDKFSVHASICVSPSMRWWEKTLKPNMVEINSAIDLVNALRNSGDRLVVVDFYSPGCGGCRTLHPKICQMAELHPDAIFLKVNHENLTTMCKCLNVHVLPFFKFYRGAEGRVSSFSCTNATIKKFKAAIAKHGTHRCSIGSPKGLDEAELQRLVESGELLKDWSLPITDNQVMDDLLLASMGIPDCKNRAIDRMSFEEISDVSPRS